MSDWTFDGFGPQFIEHAERHLPHYRLTHGIVCHVARFAVPDGGQVADLGCSTGDALRSIGASVRDRRVTAYGYDIDQSMIDQAQENLSRLPNLTSHLYRADLLADDLRHDRADLTLLLWTLQFLPPALRGQVLAAAWKRAAPTGCLLVAAKIRLPSGRWQEIADDALAEYKMSRGLTVEEIRAKAESLRGVMVVDAPYRLVAMIREAGWRDPVVLFRWQGWVLVGAWASEAGGDWV